jgi:hypothetical protein
MNRFSALYNGPSFSFDNYVLDEYNWPDLKLFLFFF